MKKFEKAAGYPPHTARRIRQTVVTRDWGREGWYIYVKFQQELGTQFLVSGFTLHDGTGTAAFCDFKKAQDLVASKGVFGKLKQDAINHI